MVSQHVSLIIQIIKEQINKDDVRQEKLNIVSTFNF